MNPPSPANVICMSEICPTYPVRTTSDRATIAVVKVVVSASSHDRSNVRSITIATAAQMAMGSQRVARTGANGGRPSETAPLPGSARPATTITRITRANGAAFCTPGSVQTLKSQICAQAIPKAATVVMPKDEKRPTRAATSAGSTSSVMPAVSSPVNGAMSAPASAARAHPRPQFAAEMTVGE